MMNKSVLFLAVNGLDSSAFTKLWQCFGNLNSSTHIASFIAAEEITDSQGMINTHSDMSFQDAAEQTPDVVVIADHVTAHAIKDDLAAQTVLIRAFERNAAIVSVGDGAVALIGAGIVNGMMIAASPSMEEQLEKAGARLSDEPIAVSNNIFSAREDADIQLLCNIVSEYITTLREEAA